MKNFTFLLYILTKSISSIKPELVETLQNWISSTANLDPENIDSVKFCRALKLTEDQTDKYFQNLTEESSDKFWQTLTTNKIRAINLFQSEYPIQLLQTPDPPLILYVRGGDINLLQSDSLAMVGSRKATSYGKIVVNKLLEGLTNSNLTIISGLAFGIDATVHQIALKNHLSTLAVLGSGVDDSSIYPKANFNLAREILQSGGLIISEYPPLSPAMKHQFVARNRIIAGLAQVTVVVEAAKKSGALITADFAMDYNRSVMAVPGSILSPQSSGTNCLIQQGAQILTSINDIYNEFGIEPKIASESKIEFSEPQLAVLKCMQTETVELETLLEATKLSIAELFPILTELELHKIITQTSPQVYQKL